MQAQPAREQGAESLAAQLAAGEQPAKKRGMFAGLKLDAGGDRDRSGRERDKFAGLKLPAQGRAERQGRAPASQGHIERAKVSQAAEG